MSQIALIREAMETIIEGVLPAYKKLSDSFDTFDNAMQLLEKGFAIGYGPGEGVYSEWCPGMIRQRREFRVALTNIYVPNTSQDFRIGLETQLMEDEFKVLAAISNSVTVNNTAINAIFSFDQGLQYLTSNDDKQFIMIILSFTVDYIEGV